MGWGASRLLPAGEAYPARFPRLSNEVWHRREAELTRAPWTVSLASSGYLARAELSAEDGNALSAKELEQAQGFIDTHLGLVGLTQRAPLTKWDDGLYYVSKVDDPRFGISVLHRGTKVTITGHLWPGLTLRSRARREPNDLLRPWLGTRVVSGDPIEQHPCDPVHSVNDCAQPSEPEIAIVGPEIAHYAVTASAVDDFIEVREVLVLDLPAHPKSLDAGRPVPPATLDARTGEALEVATFQTGMCEDRACVTWGSVRTEQNALFWHWVSFERLQLDVVFRQ